jgi:hypothetical protein
MNDDNTQGGAEPSLASAGSHNTHMATARLSAANTWLQEEIKRLRLTDEEREAIADAASRYVAGITPKAQEYTATLRGLLERLT